MKKQVFTRLAMLSLLILASLMLSTSTKWQRIEARSTGRALPLTAITPVGFNAWASNGPEGAEIYSLAMAPGDPKILYAGTNDGLFRSSDGGATWNKAGLAASSVGSLAIDPNNTDVLYAVSFAGSRSTVSKSTDGGASWHEANNGLKDDLNVLVVDPHDSNTLYVGAYYEGVFKSTDGGANWKQISNGSLFGANSLVIDPANSNTLYAVFYDWDYGNFLLKSTDGGVNWKNPVNSEDLVNGPTALAIDPHNPNVLYVGTYPHAAKSTDGGASWSASDTGLPRYDVSTLAIDSVNSATIYAGTYGGGVFKSTDGGGRWSEFNAGLTDLNISKLAIDPSGVDLLAGTSAGVFGYRHQAGCVDMLSLTDQSLEFEGGTESVNVIAGSECSWASISNAGWINVTPDGSSSGNGVVSYTVAAHTASTRSRITTLLIGGQNITITQTGPPLVISVAWARGKTLNVYGERFDAGAVILLNGEEQKTRNDSRDPSGFFGFLIAKKAAKNIVSGQSVRLQVRNTNGMLSPEFTFTRE